MGNCGDNSIQKYYYDKNLGKCLSFDHKPCNFYDLNVNNFDTLEACQTICEKGEFQSESTQPDNCKIDKDAGPCRASVPSYFYNRSANECQKFIYGGCHGNSNRFSSISSCILSCVTN